MHLAATGILSVRSDRQHFRRFRCFTLTFIFLQVPTTISSLTPTLSYVMTDMSHNKHKNENENKPGKPENSAPIVMATPHPRPTAGHRVVGSGQWAPAC